MFGPAHLRTPTHLTPLSWTARCRAPQIVGPTICQTRTNLGHPHFRTPFFSTPQCMAPLICCPPAFLDSHVCKPVRLGHLRIEPICIWTILAQQMGDSQTRITTIAPQFPGLQGCVLLKGLVNLRTFANMLRYSMSGTMLQNYRTQKNCTNVSCTHRSSERNDTRTCKLQLSCCPAVFSCAAPVTISRSPS